VHAQEAWRSLEAEALEMGEQPVHVVRVGGHRPANRVADADDSARDPASRERQLLLLDIHPSIIALANPRPLELGRSLESATRW